VDVPGCEGPPQMLSQIDLFQQCTATHRHSVSQGMEVAGTSTGFWSPDWEALGQLSVERDWQLDQASNHEALVVPERLGKRFHGKGGRLRQQSLERDLGLQSSQGRTDAEVDTPAETDVMAGTPSVNVDPVGIGVGLGIAVRGWPYQNQTRSRVELDVSERGPCQHAAGVTAEWRIDATRLFYEGWDEGGLRSEMLLQRWLLGEDSDSCPKKAGRRLAPGCQEDAQNSERFHVVELAIYHGLSAHPDDGRRVPFTS
jgi:hypothetical protein